MSPPSHDPQGRRAGDDADLFGWTLVRDYAGFVLRAPLRHKAIALAAFLLVVSGAFVASKTLPFRWGVHATLLAQGNRMMGALSNPALNREWDTPTRGARELIIRRDNLIALLKQTDFVNKYLATRAPAVRLRDWIYQKLGAPERDPDELLERLADSLEERLWVNAGPEGTLTIGFEWSNPELAFQLVQAATQSFLEEKYANEIKAVSEAIAILEGHDARVQREIAATIEQVEEKERALRSRLGPRRTPAPRPRVAVDEDLARIENTLVARRRALADLEDFRARRLAEMQAQLLQQQGMYAPQHPALATTRQAIEGLSTPSPQVAALRAEVEDLEREVSRRGGRTSDAAAAAASAALAQADFSEARLRLESEDPRLEFERRQLQNLLRQHANLLDRIDSARVEMDTAQAAFKYRYSIVTPPQLPKKPVKAYGLMLFVAGLVGGLGLAFFASAALDLWSGRLLERWQVEHVLDVPVLAELDR